MSRPILFPSSRAKVMTTGTELVPAYATGSACFVVSISKNKKEITVRYVDGGEKAWNVSHICKYYVIKNSDEHKQLAASGVPSFIKKNLKR